MKLERLRIFVAIAEYRNITIAARHLHLSQPAVSRHLKSLEQEFGVKLHFVGNHGIDLTDHGQSLYHDAEALIRQLDRLEKNFKNVVTRGRSERLRIGGTLASSAAFLPSVAAAFKRSHRKTEVVVQTDTSPRLEEKVINRQLDLAVLTRPSFSPLLEYEHCRRQNLVAFVSTKHSVGRKSRLTFDELCRAPLVLRGAVNGKMSRAEKAIRQMAKKHTRFNVAMHCDSHRVIVDAVKRGIGVGFSYRDFIEDDLRHGSVKVIKVPELNIFFDTFVTYLKDQPMPIPTQQFLALLRQRSRKIRATEQSSQPAANVEAQENGIALN